MVALAVLLGVTVFAERFIGQGGLAGILLVLGILTAVAVSLAGAVKQSHALRKIVRVTNPESIHTQLDRATKETLVGK